MRTHSTTLILALIVAPSSLCATLPVAWVSESEEYVQLLRAKLTTDWDVRWCGANGTACTAGTDPSSGAVRAIVGRPVAGDLSALPKLALVQGASWFQEYAPAAVPLRASIAFADNYPSIVLALEPLAEFCIAAIFEWLYSLRARSAAMLDCAWSADAPARCASGSAATNHTRFSDLTIGVLGYGHIGEQVAKRAAALGATVVATTLPNHVVKPPPPPLAWLSADNDRLYRESDVIVETLGGPGSDGVVNATAFGLMREKSMLVGIGSDQSIDYSALYESLVANPSRFAVIDGWQQGCWHSSNCSCGAPFGAKNWPSVPELALLPNVLPLPGMAMRDADWWNGTLAQVAGNLDAIVRGTPLVHVVRNGTGAAAKKSYRHGAR